jgi:hypothetical protein
MNMLYDDIILTFHDINLISLVIKKNILGEFDGTKLPT